MNKLEGKKSFKEWTEESFKEKRESTPNKEQPKKKKIMDKPATSESENVKTGTDVNFDEFKPSWRQKSVKDFDAAAKNKNAQSVVMSYFFVAILLIGISIGSYVLWEQVISRQVTPADSPSVFVPPQPNDDETDDSQTEKEIVFYVLEIGVSGSREVSSEEIETSCGDVLVPITITKTFNSNSISEISLVREALNQLFIVVGEVYDEEKNLVNDVANSGLELDTIAKVNDDLEVNMVGTFATVGVCNTERILTQIEETALVNAPNQKITFKLDGSTAEYDKLQD